MQPRELFIVEGESAARAVERVIDPHVQSVLAMQGKPLNAWKATRARVEAHPLFSALIAELGCGIESSFDWNQCRYHQVILVFDPDADGIHGAALMSWFFLKWMPLLVSEGRLLIAMPPRGELTSATGERMLYDSDSQASQTMKNHLEQRGVELRKKPYRGLGSMDASVLKDHCVAPGTRRLKRLSTETIEASLRAFRVSK
jgi:DNA gyrase subunit B/topoisomerase-4 subunit B